MLFSLYSVTVVSLIGIGTFWAVRWLLLIDCDNNFSKVLLRQLIFESCLRVFKLENFVYHGFNLVLCDNLVQADSHLTRTYEYTVKLKSQTPSLDEDGRREF
jgi:hypothetical protein